MKPWGTTIRHRRANGRCMASCLRAAHPRTVPHPHASPFFQRRKTARQVSTYRAPPTPARAARASARRVAFRRPNRNMRRLPAGRYSRFQRQTAIARSFAAHRIARRRAARLSSMVAPYAHLRFRAHGASQLRVEGGSPCLRTCTTAACTATTSTKPSAGTRTWASACCSAPTPWRATSRSRWRG